MRTTSLLVCDFPQPVLTAQTDSKGLVDFTEVLLYPISQKSAPAAFTRADLFITF